MDSASASLLEIPRQLAFVFSKLDAWKPPHTERHLVNVEGITPRVNEHSLPPDINTYTLDDYRRQFCKDTFGILTDKPILRPILEKARDDEEQQSLMISKLLYRYVYDSTLSPERRRVIADYIIQCGLDSSSLRDEILLQICNLTFKWSNTGSDNSDASRSTWQLMVHCLSSFKPSPPLYNCLLKYVSDHAFNGYKLFCQRKLLGGPHWSTTVPRIYPPSLLEWIATQRQNEMVLQGVFTDGYTLMGHVDSWVTCEEFASYLLSCRQVTSGTHGWTVALTDEEGVYECAGDDYVLDVVGEMDVAPGFNCCNSQFLVTKNSSSRSSAQYADSPHNIDNPRLMEIDVEEITQPIPVQMRRFVDTSPPDVTQSSSVPVYGQSALNARYNVTGQRGENASTEVRSSTNGWHTDTSASRGSVGYTRHISRGPEAGKSSRDTMMFGSGTTDMDQWLEKVFDQALDGTVDDNLEERYTLSARLKGGGDNLGQQPPRTGQRTILNAVQPPQQTSTLYRQPAQPLLAPQSAVSPQTFTLLGSKSHQTPTFVTPTAGSIPVQSAVLPQNLMSAPGGSIPMQSNVLQHNYMSPPVSSVPLPAAVLPQNFVTPVASSIPVPSAVVPQNFVSPAVSSIPVPQNYLSPMTGSIPVGTLPVVPTLTAEQLLQQQMFQQQQWQLQRENITLQAQLEAQQMQNELLKQSIHQQQQLQQLQQQQQFAKEATPDLTTQQQPVRPVVPTVIAVGSSPQELSAPGPITQGPLPSQLDTPGSVDMNRRHSNYVSAPSNGEVRVNSAMPVMVTQSSSAAETTVSRYEMVNVTSTSRTGSGIDEVRSSVSTPASNISSGGSMYDAVEPKHSLSPVNAVRPPSLSPVIPQAPPAPPPLHRPEKLSSIIDEDSDAAAAAEAARVAVSQTTNVAAANRLSGVLATDRRMDGVSAGAKSNGAVVTRNSNTNATNRVASQYYNGAVKDVSAGAVANRMSRIPAVVPVPEDVAADRPIRVGKIQWPPPRSDEPDSKPVVRVGRLEIEESTVIDEMVEVPPRPSAEVTRQKINERIIATRPPDVQPDRKPQPANKAVVASPVVLPDIVRTEVPKPEPSVKRTEPEPVRPLEPPKMSSEMKMRQETLEKQLRAKDSDILKSVDTDRAVIQDPLPRDIPPAAVVKAPVVELVQETTKQQAFDLKTLETVPTVLYEADCSKSTFITYSTVPWNLNIRKEVLYSLERLDDELMVDLLYAQIISDVYSDSVRISPRDRDALVSVLDVHKINRKQILTDQVPETVKTMVIKTAKNWPFYFSRIYAVNGGRREPDVHLISIGHSGVRLLRKHQQPQPFLDIVHHFKYEDILDVSVPKPKSLQIHVESKYVFLYTHRAEQIQSLIEAFCIESDKNLTRVRAVKNYKGQDPSHLRFCKRDIITVMDENADILKGLMYGAVHGRVGLFPGDLVVKLNAIKPAAVNQTLYNPPKTETIGLSDTLRGSLADAKNKYTMLEYAMLYFKESPYRDTVPQSKQGIQEISSLRLRNGSRQSNGTNEDWTWRDQVELIKWSNTPIRCSLLKLDSPAINNMALECFVNLLKYMGDMPLSAEPSAGGKDVIQCGMNIFKCCYENPAIRDEVYCQIIKQITNNRSTKSDSPQLGWRFLTLVTSYFMCSDSLKPYFVSYLQQTANDERRANYMLAKTCLHNLNQTMMYGGRQTFPSKMELIAITRGTSSNQMIVSLPGGSPIRIAVMSSTVINDVIDQICNIMDIRRHSEQQEFALYCIAKEGDDECFPEAPDVYLLDVIKTKLSKTKSFNLLVQRVTWFFPLHLDLGNQTYISAMYQQIRPDYIDGYLCVIKSKKLPDFLKAEIAQLAALQIRAADKLELPPEKDMEVYIPNNVLRMRDSSSSDWRKMAEQKLNGVKQLSQFECQVQFLAILNKWPLGFGTYFTVQVVSGVAKGKRDKGLYMLAVNGTGLHFCLPDTHEESLFMSYQQQVSVKRVEFHGSDVLDIQGANGNSSQTTQLQLRTDEAEHIEALITRYMSMVKAGSTSTMAKPQQSTQLEY